MISPTNLTAIVAEQHVADLQRAAAAAGPRRPIAFRLRWRSRPESKTQPSVSAGIGTSPEPTV